LQPREETRVAVGSEIAFGHLDERWVVSDAGAPQVMVVNAGGQVQLPAIEGVIAIPSIDQPNATVYLTSEGTWCVDGNDLHALGVTDGQFFNVDAESWRFCCPDGVAPTATAEAMPGDVPPVLHFLVSSDEEAVELVLEYAARRVSLGFRAHNHLLLTLARSRLEDIEREFPPTSCGWVYKEDLLAGNDPTQRIDCDVFRIRQHFCAHAPDVAGSIVERRPRTRQLRIGTAKLRITKV
jgi:hypothetical protein